MSSGRLASTVCPHTGNVIVDRRSAPMTGLKWEKLVQSLVPLSRPHRLLPTGTDGCNERLVSEDAADGQCGG